MAIKEYNIKSLKEYMECINELHTDNNILWYRGHANGGYKLEPTIYREPYTWEKEKIFMNEFKAKAIRLMSALYNASTVKKGASYGKKIYKYNKLYVKYNKWN